MKIVFMGTPDFAVPSLEKLYNSHHKIVAVVTGPDKPAGRGKKLKPTPVKRRAEEFGIPILTPEKFTDEEFISHIKALSADLFVVVAFRILPKSVFTIPRYGTINLHASLLPNYRGAAPINWAIINGEKESGVTTFFIEEKVDTGEWILQKKINISEKETAGELHDKLSIIGADTLLETVDSIEQGRAPRIKQEGAVTKAQKITKEICYIDWKKDIVSIYNLIRGLSPFPRAFSYFKGDEFKICGAEISTMDLEKDKFAGEIVSLNRDKIFVAAGNGILEITEVQPPNKRRMSVAEYLRGYSVALGERFR